MLLAIETKGLTKTYQGHGGCRDISLAVPRGSVFGLLGPNGAGKSTLVKMLVGLLHPTSGEGKILNQPLNDLSMRQRIGFLPENFSYHDWLTGEDLLRFHGSLYGLSKDQLNRRVPQVLQMVGLTGHGNKRVGSYSKGMQQRVGLGCALVNNPEIIFLDEPTSALDPIGRKAVRDLMETLKQQGKTVFINSHLLSELETVCDQIAIIKAGRLIFQGDWREMLSQGCRAKIIVGNQAPLNQLLESLKSEVTLISQDQITADKQQIILSLTSEQVIPRVVSSLAKNGWQIYEVTPMMDSLEKIFLQYVNNTDGSAEGR
ncbi:ABC transporter ATP-binding protein [Peptococcaceae bacterium 1198_IL3148]